MSENTHKTAVLNVQPGIRRDGTMVDGDFWNDGQWLRFQRGRPKKMGGFRRITAGLTAPIQSLLSWSRQQLNVLHSFSPTKIEALLVDQNGVGNAITDRTPAGFVPAANSVWSVETMYDAAVGSAQTIILAHQNSSLQNIDDATSTTVYWAPANDLSQFQSTGVSVSGGVCACPPFAFYYGSDGVVTWTNENEPRNTTTGDAGSTRIASSKVVKGLPVRGGSGPAALFWSLDALTLASYVGGAAVFRFTPITSQSSILSQNSVIEYDGAYFWIGVDRFLMYAGGQMSEIPNTMNHNFFFDNLNFAQRQKVWAMKVPKYGEIWWFFPFGTATECTNAIIFNVREKSWYDVTLPRSSGFYSQVFNYPIMGTPTGECYLHEFGVDAVVGDTQTAIQSYAETCDIGLITGGTQNGAQEGIDVWTRLVRVEPDFVQSGEMKMYVIGREFPNSEDISSNPYPFAPNCGKIDVREQFRSIRLRFESNTVGGFYEGGKTLLHIEPGDIRS